MAAQLAEGLFLVCNLKGTLPAFLFLFFHDLKPLGGLSLTFQIYFCAKYINIRPWVISATLDL